MMVPSYFTAVLVKNLEQLSEEIKLFPEDLLWEVKGTIVNSGGNLALHLIGNLNHFIGAVIRETGYIRKRDKEFSLKNISSLIIIGEIENCRKMIMATLEKKNEEWLNQKYPVEFLGLERTNGEMLLQLTAHLNYHLGQINYLRRMISVN